MYASVCWYVYLKAGAFGSKKRLWIPAARLLVVVSCLAWVLEAKLRFSQGALSHRANLGACVCLLFSTCLKF